MKNIDLMALHKAIEKITEDGNQVFETSLAYRLLKIKSLIREEFDIILQLQRQIWLKYGTEQEDGLISIPKENVEKTKQEINQLYNMEININLPTISLDEIKDFGWSLEIIDGLKEVIKDPGDT